MDRSQVRNGAPVGASQSEAIATAHTQASTPAVTPPLTPASAVDDTSHGSLFHNYLRAFHPFDPTANLSADDEACSITVPINQGDLILVHSVHANGWADGTLITTGERGWLPTNYCEPFDHPLIRNLLNAMTQFWDLLVAGEDANLSTFVKQDSIRGLIAGVRYLLEHAGCLHRDAALVTRHVGIRRMRKGLLADLSTLVQKSKEMQQSISEAYAGEVIHVLLDELITRAFKVIMRAIKFVDIWAQETSQTGEQRAFQTAHPLTPPTDGRGLAIDVTASKQEVINPIDSAKDFTAVSPYGHRRSTSIQSDKSRQPPVSPRPLSTIFDAAPEASVSHRVSLVKGETPEELSLASVQLAKAHDQCISLIGAFLGHHLQARTPSEMVSATDRLAPACRTLLSIIDEVVQHDPRRSVSLQKAKQQFQSRLEDLIKSTQEVFRFSDVPDDEVFILPQQSSHLVIIGTNLIRTAGECVTKTRSMIEQIGDFRCSQGPADAENSMKMIELKASLPDDDVASSFTSSPTERLSGKMLPPAPAPSVRVRAEMVTEVLERPSTAISDSAASNATWPVDKQKALPPPPIDRRSLGLSHHGNRNVDAMKAPRSIRGNSISPVRKDSIGISVTGSVETFQSSARDSEFSTGPSEVSTRATTPDHTRDPKSPNSALLNSFGSVASIRSMATDVSNETEAQLLQKTYAHELILNPDGQVVGGSLPALVERLTMHESTPDPHFSTSFYVTFRLFTTPRQFAQALIERFEYAGDNKAVATPVRLRIYNVFKGWLETYWAPEADEEALEVIRLFALHRLRHQMPSIAERLLELIRKVNINYQNGAAAAPLVSSVGKSAMSLGTQYDRGSSTPEPIATKGQLNNLKMALGGASQCCISDLDPLEIARQLTIITSRAFCAIQPDELLGLAWSKAKDKAPNVRGICGLNTQISLVVSDTILAFEDAKKRALVIKHWVKVAMHFLELRNYESLMAIVGALNTSIVQRLKRTWECVSKKTKARFDELNSVVDLSRNYKSLRSKVETPVAPCLPFLGIYLTDLTFTDAGNPDTKELPGTVSETGEPITVINFDKFLRTAKIIGHIQKFQVPYKLRAIPEMQEWLENYLHSMGDGSGDAVHKFHRRSRMLEPKQDDAKLPKTSEESNQRPRTASSRHEGGRGFFRSNTFGFKMGGGTDEAA
ncbi:ras GEF [Polychaeton citri CBS 116435]|uniref:Ras GEF n=1 Tax=Polychaeton citri CBS 116435 TaxID=1314669 RepID=A0A9P4Q8B4_9PEZI|nr:ras GEF [Polychaeton citri CBS 116435]